MNDQCVLGQGCANEASSEKMNMYNKAQKSNSQLFDENYGKITWGNQDSPVIPMKTKASTLTWFGYRHVNATIQVKRYFSRADFKEVQESDFVLYTFGPFEATSRENAMEIVQGMIRRFHEQSSKLFKGEDI